MVYDKDFHDKHKIREEFFKRTFEIKNTNMFNQVTVDQFISAFTNKVEEVDDKDLEMIYYYMISGGKMNFWKILLK